MNQSRVLGRPRHTIVASLALLVGAALAPTLASGAEQTAVFGGLGGSPFIDRLPAGARIGAIRFGAGAWIDSVGVVYETADGQRVTSPLHGGTGGGACVIVLEPGERILAITGRHGQYVHAVRFVTTKGVTRMCGDASQGNEFRIDVPPGYQAVGFAGRSGQYLDAIGLALAAASGTAAAGPPEAGPAKPAGPARLADRVVVDAGLRGARFDIRLTAPASVQVHLGERRLRAGECFAASDRLYSGSPAHPPKSRHIVDFERLQINTTYWYAIRIDGGRCESGMFKTATRIDNSQ